MNDKIKWELIMVDVTWIRYVCDICMKIKKEKKNGITLITCNIFLMCYFQYRASHPSKLFVAWWSQWQIIYEMLNGPLNLHRHSCQVSSPTINQQMKGLNIKILGP